MSLLQANLLVYLKQTDWFETNLWHRGCYSEGGENICGCRGPRERVVIIAVLLLPQCIGIQTFHGQSVVIKEEYTSHLEQASSAAQLQRVV